ncbi:MAG: TonB-dependent receptor [Pseudomonadota bacterium]|uniref:TonB-dependent receptor n=1 Tax=Sphingomonas sp. ERG5 TaxID=1381597 RepID=UPI000A66B5B5|nr:TonB-dependent receptor [Sphingomonas sp. ERG5]
MRILFLSTSLFALAGAAHAAPAPAQTSDQSAEIKPLDETQDIVVTGRVGATDLRKVEASYAITTIDDAKLRISNPISAAEAFKQVPGFWVESSGGEGSNNVRSRGIPTDGFSSVALQENGLSVQYDGGLGYLNADQSFRFDETIARVEAVRGGPASIFAPNAPGGLVNFISRRGTDNPGGMVKYSWGDYDLARVDAYYGTRIADNWGVFVGGFYRRDHGLRDTGYRASDGGQIRATIDYDDGRNRFMLDVKHLDDKVPFYLPVPLTFDGKGKIIEVPGFDALHGTLAGPENAHVAIRNVGGPFDFDLTEGSHTKMTQVALESRFEMADGFGWENRTHYRDSKILRNALFPTGNVTALGDYLASLNGALAAFPGATGLRAQYATDGAPFTASANGNGLVVGGNLLSVSVPMDELITDQRFTAEFEAAGKHSFAIGGTYGYYNYRFDRYMGTALLEIADQARRLDVVAVNAAGAVVGRVTDNGFLSYGSLYDNVGMKVNAYALYAGDEWQITPKLRLDFAGRYERNDISGMVARKTTVNLGDPTTLADDKVNTGTGQFDLVDRSFDHWGWTVGANYQFTPDAGLFARYTDTFKLPSAGDYNGNPTRTDQSPIPIKMAEIGAKYSASWLNLYATGFYTKFKGVRFTDNVFDTKTNTYTQRFATADTVAYGVELEALIRPVKYFDLGLQLTWQDPQYKGFTYTELVNGKPTIRDFDGKQLIRVPKLAIRAVPAINLFKGRLRTELEIERYSERFPDIANSQVLPRYTNLNLNIRGEVTKFLTLTANITNLTNKIELTEGNPRAGSFVSGDAGARYFLARPNFGRTVRVSAAVKF